MLSRFLKLDCDFLAPSFQYHSPSRNEDWFGYGWYWAEVLGGRLGYVVSVNSSEVRLSGSCCGKEDE
jgi:hypothetical protein